VKFVTENTRRYAAMRDLFRSSRARLETLLAQHQGLVAARAPAVERQALVRAIHDLMSALGREALHENTDWLTMHRNRPVEPVV
jgi:hypothetical protein